MHGRPIRWAGERSGHTAERQRRERPLGSCSAAGEGYVVSMEKDGDTTATLPIDYAANGAPIEGRGVRFNACAWSSNCRAPVNCMRPVFGKLVACVSRLTMASAGKGAGKRKIGRSQLRPTPCLNDEAKTANKSTSLREGF